MTLRMILMAVAAAVALALIACGGHRAKFKPGDQVIRKITGEKGIVAGRLRPFADDIYWLKMSGGERDDATGALAAAGERTELNRHWHLNGPYYEDDLILIHE